MQFDFNWSWQLIRIHSGHLGSGDWKVKQQDNILFLSHRLPFSPRNEYRIGCNDILDVQVERIEDDKQFVNISFSEERSCQALVDQSDLELLLKMVSDSSAAPIEDRNTNGWIKGLLIFFAACIIFELVK